MHRIHYVSRTGSVHEWFLVHANDGTISSHAEILGRDTSSTGQMRGDG
jgi:hypothetical protein